jgi:hypothetical protein
MVQRNVTGNCTLAVSIYPEHANRAFAGTLHYMEILWKISFCLYCTIRMNVTLHRNARENVVVYIHLKITVKLLYLDLEVIQLLEVLCFHDNNIIPSFTLSSLYTRR